MFFLRKKNPLPPSKPLYGVNLGGWLVLEKWMTPSVFKGSDATDEYNLWLSPRKEQAAVIRKHRDTFITKQDFEWLKTHGIEAVRIPVGYWVFGDEPPFEGAIEYVDKAIDWAEQTGMKVLLDMHAAPGSQNGKDHSGRIGEKQWHTKEKNVIQTLEIVTKLAERYKSSPSLLGIELLNEPGWLLIRRRLHKYYDAAYRSIRDLCGDDVWVVFSDYFPPRRWLRDIKKGRYANVYIDTHQYQAFRKEDKKLNLSGHMHKTLEDIPRMLGKTAKHQPVIVGEWSLVLNPLSLQEFNERQQAEARRAYAAAQLIAYEQTTAWFFWSYKTEGGGGWSLRDSIEKGLLPDFNKITRL